MNRIFQIGNFCFRLCCPDEVTVPPNFMRFAVEAGEPDYTYKIKIEDHFPQAAGRVLARRPDLLVYEVPAGESRYIGIKGVEGYYAYYEEQFKNCAKVILNPERLQGLNIDPVFTSLLALERKMIYRDSLILHCAYVRYQGEAILFSAPSETGKTTQANLWEKYRGSQTINGDRALIRKEDGRWTAGGVAGMRDVRCML